MIRGMVIDMNDEQLLLSNASNQASRFNNSMALGHPVLKLMQSAIMTLRNE